MDDYAWLNQKEQFNFLSTNEKSDLSFEYSLLNLQRFDTIEIYCSVCSNDELEIVPTKAFFYGFGYAIYELGKGIKGFKNLFIAINNPKHKKNNTYLVTCKCDCHSDLKYTKVFSTRMVLIEKIIFE